jgi:phosphate starvation-inducible membrane PsiE
MRETVKELVKSSVISIGMAMTIFCLVGVVFDVGYKGNFSLDDYRFTKMVAGCVLVGLGFGVPTIVYRKDNLPMPIRVIIHMGIGCVVYTIIAYAVGWIGGSATIGQGILIAAIQLAVAFLIWFLFMKHYRAEAKRMNDRIQAMK